MSGLYNNIMTNSQQAYASPYITPSQTPLNQHRNAPSIYGSPYSQNLSQFNGHFNVPGGHHMTGSGLNTNSIACPVPNQWQFPGQIRHQLPFAAQPRVQRPFTQNVDDSFWKVVHNSPLDALMGRASAAPVIVPTPTPTPAPTPVPSPEEFIDLTNDKDEVQVIPTPPKPRQVKPKRPLPSWMKDGRSDALKRAQGDLKDSLILFKEQQGANENTQLTDEISAPLPTKSDQTKSKKRPAAGTASRTAPKRAKKAKRASRKEAKEDSEHETLKEAEADLRRLLEEQKEKEQEEKNSGNGVEDTRENESSDEDVAEVTRLLEESDDEEQQGQEEEADSAATLQTLPSGWERYLLPADDEPQEQSGELEIVYPSDDDEVSEEE